MCSIEGYTSAIRAILLNKYEFSNTYNHPPEIRIPEYLNICSKSPEQKRIAYNAIKVFYQYVIKKPCPYEMQKCKRRRRLPVTLTRKEIDTLLAQITNRKHYLMIALMYAAGLRVSEVTSLKVKDVDLNALSVHIRDSKHHRDRFSLLSAKLIPGLIFCMYKRLPENYLFINQSRRKYSPRTLQQVITNAWRKTKINKKVTCHTLRHSFATHLKEQGIDIKDIQTLLGHKSIKTTMVYIHLADPLSRKIQSPF